MGDEETIIFCLFAKVVAALFGVSETRAAKAKASKANNDVKTICSKGSLSGRKTGDLRDTASTV